MSVWPFSAIGGWLADYLTTPGRRGAPAPDAPVHLLLCIADHFEPKFGNVTWRRQRERVRRWLNDYPRLFERFADSDGHPPRHSFFYPAEEYEPAHLDSLADLCRDGLGEVEVHLHHDNDTADNLRRTLMKFRDRLALRHGLLARRRGGDDVAYGFIHGNWALDNSRPDGRWCGVNNELDVLRDTGCYADFTMPSFPDPCQTRTINSIYYAVGRPGCAKSHNTGIRVGVGRPPERGLLMIQGPLVLDWGRRKWGLLPRVENGCLQGNQAPSERRIDRWLAARVQVPSRPDWYFVKLHTHGANEQNMPVLLGEPMARFHEALARRAADNRNFHYHYVTAREMANLVKAAEAGWTGSVEDVRDYEWLWQGARSSQSVGGRRPATGAIP
jgi:hypothetical protein